MGTASQRSAGNANANADKLQHGDVMVNKEGEYLVLQVLSSVNEDTDKSVSEGVTAGSILIIVRFHFIKAEMWG